MDNRDKCKMQGKKKFLEENTNEKSLDIFGYGDYFLDITPKGL